MTQAEVRRAFGNLQPDQQLQVLALLAHNVTVAARTAYPGQVDEHVVVDKLRAFNEVLHTITGQITPLMKGDSNRYPDDLFVDALFELAHQGNCERDLIDAFAWSYSATAVPV